MYGVTKGPVTLTGPEEVRVIASGKDFANTSVEEDPPALEVAVANW